MQKKDSNGSAKSRLQNSATAEKILSMLNTAYPHNHEDMNFLKFRTPFELLIMTILSAQTTDKTVNSIREELFRKYPNPETLAKADIKDVEKIVRPTGYYHSKAKNIIGAAQGLVDNFGGNVPHTIEELTTLPGVGRKTANIVTNNAYYKAFGIAVDTHVKRLSIRLGFTDKTEPEKIEQDLVKIFDEKWWGYVNYLLISHGRAVCDAKKPACNRCIINEYCRFHE